MNNEVSIGRVLRTGIVLIIISMIYMLFSVIRYIFGEQVSTLSIYPFIYVCLAFAFAYFFAHFIRIRSSVFLIGLCVISLIAALTVALWAGTEPASDFQLLYELADSLRKGDFDKLTGDAYFLKWAYQSFFVMYEALVITVFPGGIAALIVFNAIYMTGIVILIYLISKCLFSENTARLISILYLLYPAPYFLSSVLTNQHISLFFVLLGVWVIFCRYDTAHAITGGFFVALGSAFRPDGTIAALSLAMLIVIIFTYTLKAGFANAVKSAMPLALSIISYAAVGMLVSWIVLLSGVNPNGQKNSDPLWKFVLGLNSDSNGAYSQELTEQIFSIDDEAERHSLERDIIGRHLSIDMKDLFRFFGKKTASYWGNYESTDWAFADTDERIVPIVNKPLKGSLVILKQAERVFFLIAVLLSILSLAALWRKKTVNILYVFLGLIVFAFFVIYIFIEIQPRYRYFSYPFIFIMTGIWIERSPILTGARAFMAPPHTGTDE